MLITGPNPTKLLFPCNSHLLFSTIKLGHCITQTIFLICYKVSSLTLRIGKRVNQSLVVGFVPGVLSGSIRFFILRAL